MSKEQQLQESEYDLPYHYFPRVSGADVVLYPHWSWGFRYVGGIGLLLATLRDLPFTSLVDVGCGDGRLLREITREFPGARLRGVDYSPRAVELARAMNPGLDYRVHDVMQAQAAETYDIVSLIEVLEHIPVDHLDAFVAGLARLMHSGSRLLITVPHRNDPLNVKHFQHFDPESLDLVMAPLFVRRNVFYFDRRSALLDAWQRFMCNKYFIVRHRGLTKAFYRYYVDRCLAADAASCLRFGALYTLK